MAVGRLYAMYPRTPHLPYRVRALLDFLVEVFGGEVPRWGRGLELVG